MGDYANRVFAVVRRIPRGKVAVKELCAMPTLGRPFIDEALGRLDARVGLPRSGRISTHFAHVDDDRFQIEGRAGAVNRLPHQTPQTSKIRSMVSSRDAWEIVSLRYFSSISASRSFWT